MSYPRQLQCLVIEDEPEAKTLYDEIFVALAQDDPTILKPRYAFSKQEAEDALDAPFFYQVVILDLRLPVRANLPPDDSVTVGLALLERCQKRDAYPIPALIIITGHAEKTEQSKLRDTLRDSFSYGELIIKGGNPTGEIKRAIQKAREYGDLGLHIQETKSLRVPGLSPRDEDLLRRAALRNNAIGIDLRWWSSEYSKPTGQFAALKGWTKVLMGHFLLGDGQGRSRPVFCKCMAAAELDVVARDAQLLEQKLSHIKVKASTRSGDRSLLVTEKTGTGELDPVSLDEYLSRGSEEPEHISRIAADVVRQTEMLGDTSFDVGPLHTKLWPHDDGRLTQSRKRHPARSTAALDALRADALDTLRHIRSHSTPSRVAMRQCLHGDLNVTNIAVDGGTETKGYIFDASGIRPGLAMWDLATIEVTALLHLPPNTTESIVISCGELLYSSDFVPVDTAQSSTRAANTVALIRALRSHANNTNRRSSYTLCVFDVALLQVGGLAWPSGNKVCSFADAVLLADLAAGWLRRVAPNLIAGGDELLHVDS